MRTNSLSAVLRAAAMLVGVSGQIIAQDSSTKFKDRYAIWQEPHHFTLGVMSYDMAYLPHWYENAKPGLILDPDMDVFREAGLNLLDDISMSGSSRTSPCTLQFAFKTSTIPKHCRARHEASPQML